MSDGLESPEMCCTSPLKITLMRPLELGSWQYNDLSVLKTIMHVLCTNEPPPEIVSCGSGFTTAAHKNALVLVTCSGDAVGRTAVRRTGGGEKQGDDQGRFEPSKKVLSKM